MGPRVESYSPHCMSYGGPGGRGRGGGTSATHYQTLILPQSNSCSKYNVLHKVE